LLILYRRGQWYSADEYHYDATNGGQADPPSAGLAEWLGISLGLEKGEKQFTNSLLKNSLSPFSV